MKVPLRELPDGVRFELLRTGQKFRLVGRVLDRNRLRIVCVRQGDGCTTTLNHQCLVSPIIKPRVKLKRGNAK